MAVFMIIEHNRRKLMDEMCDDATTENSFIEKYTHNIPDVAYAKDFTGKTPLIIAAKFNWVKVATMILNHSTYSLDITDSTGSALWYACDLGHLEMVKLLIEYGADKRKHCIDELFRAVQNNRTGVVKFLIEHGYHVDTINFELRHSTMVTWAATFNHLEVVKYLVDAGANLNLQNGNGNTALTVAAFNGYYEMVKYLFSKGAIVNHINKYGRTYLLGTIVQSHKHPHTENMLKTIRFLATDQIKGVATVFHELPAYVLMWITDWLDGSNYLNDYKKIRIIEGIKRSVDQIKLYNKN